MKKPDAVTIISYDDFKEKIWRLRVENLLFVGRRTRDELNRLKIETVGELARSDRSYLKAILGKSGESLWDIANGFDFSAVSLFGEREIQKSISQSTTLPYDVTTYEEADSVLNTLCYNVSRELKSKSYYTSRLKLFVKFYDFSSFVRQVKMPLPTTNHEDIMLYASELFKSNVDFIKPVRSIGIGAEDLRDCVDEQIPLVIQETDSALESVISKYTIQRASTLKNRKLCEIDSKHICFENAR